MIVGLASHNGNSTSASLATTAINSDEDDSWKQIDYGMSRNGKKVSSYGKSEK